MSTLLAKVAVASAALALICWSSQHWLLNDWAHQAFAPRLGWLLLTIVAGIVAFVGCGLALRIDEMRELVSALRRHAVKR